MYYHKLSQQSFHFRNNKKAHATFLHSWRGDPPVLRCALHRCCNLNRKRSAPVQKDTRAAAVLEFASRSVWSEWEVGKNSGKKIAPNKAHGKRLEGILATQHKKKRKWSFQQQLCGCKHSVTHTHTHARHHQVTNRIPSKLPRWRKGMKMKHQYEQRNKTWNKEAVHPYLCVCVYVPP